MKKDFHALSKLLLGSPQKIVITMHQRPDGDALGSSLALAKLWEAYGHQVEVISITPIPSFLAWMPGIADVLVYEKSKRTTAKHLQEADVICCVDFSATKRVGKMQALLEAHLSRAKVVILDHHLEPEAFSDIMLWDPTTPASALLVYDLVAFMDPNKCTKTMATCLYVGILTDTGGFQTSNMIPYAHEVAKVLITQGVKPNAVHAALYSNSSITRMRFLGYVLTHCLQVHPRINSAFIAITREDFKRFALQPGDTEGLVYYALDLKGIIYAVLLTEQSEGEIRISFRCKEDKRVDIIAKHFNGGGHKKAAGGVSKETMAITIAYLKEIFIKEQVNL